MAETQTQQTQLAASILPLSLLCVCNFTVAPATATVITINHWPVGLWTIAVLQQQQAPLPPVKLAMLSRYARPTRPPQVARAHSIGPSTKRGSILLLSLSIPNKIISSYPVVAFALAFVALALQAKCSRDIGRRGKISMASECRLLACLPALLCSALLVLLALPAQLACLLADWGRLRHQREIGTRRRRWLLSAAAKVASL